MHAAFIDELPSSRFDIREVDDPQVQPGELKISVEACGICGTDIHIVSGDSYRPTLPFVLGHEPVGYVCEVGAGCDPAWLGKRITMTLFEGCGMCQLCRAGDQRLCASMQSIVGVDRRWGGFAEAMLVPSGQAIEIPPALDSGGAATLVDAGATAANAADVVLRQDSRDVLVIGAGPVGFILAELLTLSGRKTSVIEPLPARRDLVRMRGHEVVASLEDLSHVPKVVVDCAGAPGVAPSVLSCLPAHGLLLSVGYRLEQDIDFSRVARNELVIRGIRSGSRAHLAKVLELAAEGLIQLPPIQAWRLSEIDQAFDALRDGRLAGKAVVSVGRKES